MPTVVHGSKIWNRSIFLDRGLVTMNLFMSQPLAHVLPEMQILYLSTTVNQLKCTGIEPIGTELARKNLPLAGRLSKANTRSLGTRGCAGLQGAFQPTALPKAASKASKTLQRRRILQKEIQSMINKSDTEETTPKGHGFLSMVFLVPKKDGGQRPVMNLTI